jgi:hypothetical protein
MAIPHIQSAIPKRRYQYGEFTITLLTDIQSDDPHDYLFLMAAVREGNTQPEVYITCEAIMQNETRTYQVRVLSDQQEHIISTQPQWGNETAFCEFALQGISQMFELSDEQVTPIG